MVVELEPLLAAHLQERQQVIEEALDRYLQPAAAWPERLQAAMRYSVLAPAKRLRPLLVCEAATVCGARFQDALPAACAVEFIHTYSLIHDDLPAMDDDDLRRGRPTCHRQFDEATAILAGDALIPLAFQVLLQDLPGLIGAECARALAVAAGPAQLVGGQADDLAAEHREGGAELLESIHLRKTAAMIAVSLKMGGICAKASASEVDNLENFGKKLGLAFQITDDLLDLKGDQATMGKRVQKDQTSGKLTYPSAWGVEASEREAAKLIAAALQSLAEFGERAEALRGLARFVLLRTR